MKIKFKYDYCKSPRKQVTTTINKELHKNLQKLSIDLDQPTSKMYDVMIKMIFEDDTLKNEFLNELKKY